MSFTIGRHFITLSFIKALKGSGRYRLDYCTGRWFRFLFVEVDIKKPNGIRGIV